MEKKFLPLEVETPFQMPMQTLTWFIHEMQVCSYLSSVSEPKSLSVAHKFLRDSAMFYFRTHSAFQRFFSRVLPIHTGAFSHHEKGHTPSHSLSGSSSFSNQPEEHFLPFLIPSPSLKLVHLEQLQSL